MSSPVMRAAASEQVARKALMMQWQKDIENQGGGRRAQKQFEKSIKVSARPPIHPSVFDACQQCLMPRGRSKEREGLRMTARYSTKGSRSS